MHKSLLRAYVQKTYPLSLACQVRSQCRSPQEWIMGRDHVVILIITRLVCASLQRRMDQPKNAIHGWKQRQKPAVPWWKKNDPYPLGCGSKPMRSHFGVGAPPILEPILVGIGMFTGVTGF